MSRRTAGASQGHEPIVWARQESCKHQHMARLLSQDESSCTVRWENGDVETVSKDCVRTDLPERSRKKPKLYSEFSSPKAEGPQCSALVTPLTSPDVTRSDGRRRTVVSPSLTSSSEDTKPSTAEANQREPTVAPDSSESKPLAQVKLEMFQMCKPQQSTDALERERRIELRLKTNETPHGEPRKTFRRGCHKRCITTVLGGMGTDPSPIVKKAPVEFADEQGDIVRLFDHDTNPFVDADEFYIAGTSDWNPWTPAFIGDVGFINKTFVNGLDRENQESFHLFLNCSKKKHEPHYHGPQAKNKYHYLGRYRVVPNDEDSEIQEVGKTFLYSSLPTDSQFTMADHYRRHGYVFPIKDDNGRVVGEASNDRAEEYLDEARTLLESEKPGSWEEMSPEKKFTHAWVSMLLDINYKIHIVPVEFVSYDEKLYEKLVEIEAFNGEVSLEPAELGPM